MLSQAEADQIRESRDRQVARQKELQQEVSSAQEASKSRSKLNRDLISIRRDIDDFAHKISAELSQLKQQIDKQKDSVPERKRSQSDAAKITSEERRLTSAQEKLTQLLSQFEDLNEEVGGQHAAEAIVDNYLQIVEGYCAYTTSVTKQLQNAGHLALSFVDFESELSWLIRRHDQAIAQIESAKLERIEALNRKIALQQSLSDLSAEVEAVEQARVPGRLDIFPAKFDELRQLSFKLHAIHKEYQNVMPKATEIRSEIHNIRAGQSEWQIRQLEILSGLDREVSCLSLFNDSGALEIGRKIETRERLEKELEAARKAVVELQNESVSVIELKSRLEREQSEKKELAEAYAVGKSRVAKLSILLGRKQRVIEDLDHGDLLTRK
jgi:chromosome segregation ATPase